MTRIVIVTWTVIRIVVAVFCVGWALLHLRAFDRFLGLTLPQVLVTFGIALLFAGGFVVLYCGALLGTPGILPAEFIGFGPFRYVRNPMTLGAVAMICGLGFFSRSISIVIFAAIFSVAMHGFVVFVEEPGLEQRFGPSYLRYKQAVNRWLPSKPSS